MKNFPYCSAISSPSKYAAPPVLSDPPHAAHPFLAKRPLIVSRVGPADFFGSLNRLHSIDRRRSVAFHGSATWAENAFGCSYFAPCAPRRTRSRTLDSRCEISSFLTFIRIGGRENQNGLFRNFHFPGRQCSYTHFC